MANSSMPIERLQALDNVEKEIASCIQSAGMVNYQYNIAFYMEMVNNSSLN